MKVTLFSNFDSGSRLIEPGETITLGDSPSLEGWTLRQITFHSLLADNRVSIGFVALADWDSDFRLNDWAFSGLPEQHAMVGRGGSLPFTAKNVGESPQQLLGAFIGELDRECSECDEAVSAETPTDAA